MGDAIADEDADAFVAAFLMSRLADRERGSEGSLDDYCRRFPGRESLVREAWVATAPTELLGHYRLLTRLGRGGQGEVWLGEDTRLGRKVAVKLLRGIVLTSDEGLARFRREAAVASRLDHPGLCPVYDVGTADGAPYLVMRFIDGRSLASVFAEESSRGREARTDDDVRRVVSIVERLARALHAAHEDGVLHRDVKPQNIMLTHDDQPVLLDFGLARLVEDESLFTRTGEVFGTPAYLAPELLATPPATPDRSADVYGLGVTLYECLCGRRPFAAPTRAALYHQIISDTPPPVRHLEPAVSRDLAVVVQTAMERDPRRRYATAAALADDLRRCLEHRPIQARPTGIGLRLRRWYQRSPALAFTLTCLLASLIAGLAVSLRLWWTADHEQQRASSLLGEWERLADGRRLEELVLEADGGLWPAVPDKIAAIDAWLRRADDLVARLPEHRRALAELRSAATDAADTPHFADAEAAWRFHHLDLLVHGIEAFAADDVFAATVASVRDRREWAAALRQRSVDEPRAAWDSAAARVRDSAIYGGLVLRPQLGLVPLGPDPVSGLEEFADLATGTVPPRGADGRLRCDAATSVVFALLPGGTFAMGAQKADPHGANYDPEAEVIEGPVHCLTLVAFLLSKFELTQAQWQRTMGDNPSSVQSGQPDRHEIVDGRHPVENVSWNRCATCLLHRGWALPTEAQWEYACRSGSDSPWSSGPDPAALVSFANVADAGSKADYPPDYSSEAFDDGHSVHAPVGSYRANAFGLHDMHGNVAEWCADSLLRYDNPTLPGTGERQRLPVSGGAKAPAQQPAYRGGSYSSRARIARSARRDQAQAETKLPRIGMRPARALDR